MRLKLIGHFSLTLRRARLCEQLDSLEQSDKCLCRRLRVSNAPLARIKVSLTVIYAVRWKRDSSQALPLIYILCVRRIKLETPENAFALIYFLQYKKKRTKSEKCDFLHKVYNNKHIIMV